MTGPKEGKSDESSSGEDEESMRELVSFELCCVCGQVWDFVVMLEWLL